MKKLLFNIEATQPSFRTKRHGGGIYGEIVLGEIVRQGREVAVVYDSSRWLNPEILRLCESHGLEMLDVAGRSLQQIIDDIHPDIFYSPQPLGRIFELRGCEIVTTIHDLREIELGLDAAMFWRYSPGAKMLLKNFIQLLFPFYFKKRKYAKTAPYVTGKNIRFATVSNHSRSSLHLYFPEIAGKEIPVLYSPSTVVNEPLDRKRPANYFLLVSADRWEKNNLRAIMALDQLRSDGFLQDKRVIVTGVESSKRFRYRVANPDMFEFVGYVDDSELRRLYHDAYCFIYPSINEGFGYPPVEAMTYGVPVIASPFSSINEVCGDAAMFFNPFSIDELKMRILSMCDDATHASYADKALKRAASVKAKQDADLVRLVDFIYG